MATKVGDFVVDLIVDASSGNVSVSQLVSNLGELSVASVGGAAGLLAVGSALANMAAKAIDTSMELEKLYALTGADPKIVQQWEKAAQRIGISAGTIMKSINSVNTMMGDIALSKSGAPMELTSRLGIVPVKLDANGHRIGKSFFDIIGEINSPKSKYWSLTREQQQSTIRGALPGADADAMFLFIKALHSGKIKPSDIPALQDNQVRDLARVKEGEIVVGQDLVGIFQHLLISGGFFADMLDSTAKSLEKFDRWLTSKSGAQAISNVNGGLIAFFNPRNYNPLYLGRDLAKSYLSDQFGFKPMAAPAGAGQLRLNDLQGRLDVHFTGSNGQPLGKSEVFLRKKVGNVDVEHTTINAGNGGLGQ